VRPETAGCENVWRQRDALNRACSIAPVTDLTPVLLVQGGAKDPLEGIVEDEPAHQDALRGALLPGYELSSRAHPGTVERD
jgi:hypothetical protein